MRRASKSKSQARKELDGLLTTTTTMARGNRITVARLPMLTETLTRNAQWWKLGRATGSGQRVQFDGSQVLWQLYPVSASSCSGSVRSAAATPSITPPARPRRRSSPA